MDEGRIPFFLRRTLGLTSRSRFRWGEAVKLRPWDPTWMLTDPDDIRHVLTARADHYRKTPRLSGDEGKARLGEGLITLSGAAHHDRRRALHPAFRREAVARYDRVVRSRTEAMLERWRPGATVDVGRQMSALAQANIVGVLFGDELREREAEIQSAILARRRYTEYLYHSRLPAREKLPLPVVREHRRAVRVLDETIHAAIARRRGDDGPDGDLIAALLEATEADGSTLGDGGVRDEVLPLTVTGYETVGDSLGWIWYLLARHPEVEARLHDEVDRVTGGRPPVAADVTALEYTERVVAEAMRLYPPTWVYVRVPVGADTLPSGTAVPAGARLYLCQYVMHRHPAHFPDPERFDPDRFADAEARRGWTYVYFPFGVGAHRCIGEHLARLEAILVVATVARRHRLELAPGADVRPYAGITLRARDGIPMVVRERG